VKKQSTLEGNSEGGNLLHSMVEKWANRVFNDVRVEIGDLYCKDQDGHVPIGYFWMRTIPCQNPECGVEIPLTAHFYLANTKSRKVALKPIFDKNEKTIGFVIQEGKRIDFDPQEGTVSFGRARCPGCKQTIDGTRIRKLARDGKLNQRMVAVALYHQDKKGKKYRISNEKDIKLFNLAEKRLNQKIKTWKWLESPVPEERLATPDGKKVVDESGTFFVHLQPVNYGMHEFKDLFNSRQLLSIITFLDKIKSSYMGIIADCERLKVHGIDVEELAKAIMAYLAIILDRLADKNSNLVIWNTAGEKIEHVFGRTSLPMMAWNYVELHPFSGRNGDWLSNRDWVLNFIENTSIIRTPCKQIMCSSATSLPFEDNFFDAVFTDPPYYDNIPYADLSDFFYVWLKRTIGDLFPEIFKTPLSPRQKECIQNSSLIRRGTNLDESRYEELGIKDGRYFENVMTECFKEIYRTLKPKGIATIIYAHRTTSGWEMMLNSLVNAGFVVTASWPIHTELRERLRAKTSAALASSIYMVCRKIKREKVGFYREIQPAIRNSVEHRLRQFWNEGVAGGDFFISAIGPSMEIFSKYERIETYSGKEVAVSELLDYIRSVVTNFVINQLLRGASPTKIDRESQFYLAYRWTHLDNKVEFDDARKLAGAMGVSLEKLWGEKNFVKKTGKYIQVLGPKQRQEIRDTQNMVDAMHKAALLWEKGETEE